MQSPRLPGWYWSKLNDSTWTGGNPRLPGVCIQVHRRDAGWAATLYRVGGYSREFDDVRIALAHAEF